MTKAKEIIIIILGVLFGSGIVVLGYFDEVNYYLITFGITVALAVLGIELGVNLIPHNKAEVEGIKIDNEIKRLSLERETKEVIPTNATIKKVTIEQTPSLKEAIGDFVEALKPKDEVEEKKDDFPL